MSLQALYEEALGSHKRGDLAAAEGLYRQLLAAAPQSFAARHMLGVVRAQQGAIAEALSLLPPSIGGPALGSLLAGSSGLVFGLQFGVLDAALAREPGAR